MRSPKTTEISRVQARLSVLLCLLLAGEPLANAQSALPPKPVPPPGAELRGEQRVVHALDRLTFGPRPGEVAAVEQMGLNAWFERQLNPAVIDDAKLDQRLAQYPAMQLPLAELERRFPSPAQIRGMANGKLPLPDDAEARALAKDQIAFYQANEARKAAGKKPDGAASAAAATDEKMVPDAAKMAPDAEAMTPAAEKRMSAAETMAPAAGALVGRDRVPPAELQSLLSLPANDRVAAILRMPPADAVRLRQDLRPTELAQLSEGMSPAQRETLAAMRGSLQLVGQEATETRLLRDIYSDRELEAVMTDFWLNHFNVYARKNQIEPYLLPAYERETIRPHALGNFEQLLVATASSPAMLVYLDNWRSVGANSDAAARAKNRQMLRPNAKAAASQGLNENYGRELMELHTLGVSGGYTQADVTQVAKVFTGWTVEKPYGGGGAVFDQTRHEPGTKTVLGQTIRENGEKEGMAVLHLLATSPATAHFLSEKLAVRFVSDTPPPALVERMAQSFLATHGDIKSVLRTMFRSPEFWSPAFYRAKVKTPLEFVVSAARASGLEVENPAVLVGALGRLGMPLYGMQTPNGYSWKSDEWVSTGALVNRMNFSLVMSGDKLPGDVTAWAKLLGGAEQGSPAQKEQRLERLLLVDPVSEATRSTVLSQSTDANVTAQAEAQFDLRGDGGGGGKGAKGADRAARVAAASVRPPIPDDQTAAVMAGLLLGSPEFQRR